MRNYKKLPAKRSYTRETVMHAIKSFWWRKGYSPTVREIGQMTGLASTSSVHSHLKVLVREGKIRYKPTKPRTIVICEDRFDDEMSE